MGTNFYKMDGTHIGKRSAAGWYCFDCNRTLCYGGKDGIHQGRYEWHNKCPNCGNSIDNEQLNEGTAGLELGFNKNPVNPNTGIRSCSSFTWAIVKPTFYKSPIRKVKDEYGRIYSKKEFIEMLESYPIHFFNLIGKEFS